MVLSDLQDAESLGMLGDLLPAGAPGHAPPDMPLTHELLRVEAMNHFPQKKICLSGRCRLSSSVREMGGLFLSPCSSSLFPGTQNEATVEPQRSPSYLWLLFSPAASNELVLMSSPASQTGVSHI